MDMRLKFLALLAFILSMGPAVGMSIDMSEGADGTSSNGLASGGAVDLYTITGNGATLREGLVAHVRIPNGEAGAAWAGFHGAFSRTESLVVDGDVFILDAGYSGSGEGEACVTVGMDKADRDGLAFADAVVESYASVRKNYMSGYAEVSSRIQGSSDDKACASADGSAFYSIEKLAVSDESPGIRGISGTASGSADVESLASVDEPGKSPKHLGAIRGESRIYASSNSAIGFVGYSKGTLYADTSIASSFSGTGEILADIDGTASGRVSSGEMFSTQSNIPGGAKAYVDAEAAGHMISCSRTGNAGDSASASTCLVSEAWLNQFGNLNYNKAASRLSSNAEVERAAKSSSVQVDAICILYPGASLYARSNNNAEVQASLEDASLQAGLEGADSACASIDLLLMGLQDGGTKAARVKNSLNINVPEIELDGEDFARASEAFSDLHAMASDAPDSNVRVDISEHGDNEAEMEAEAFIDGTVAEPSGVFTVAKADLGIYGDKSVTAPIYSEPGLWRLSYIAESTA